jgi:caffeoyl-CoA O-methyltransferase
MFCFQSWRAQGVPKIPFSEGVALWIIAKIYKTKKILEIGTGSGYSTRWFLSALPNKGKITTIEIDSKTQKIAQKNNQLSKIPPNKKITWLLGDAIKILSDLNCKFDLIFIDGKKSDYRRYFDLSQQLLNKNGVIICDDVFWYQKNKKQLKTHKNISFSTQEIAKKLILKKAENSMKKTINYLQNQPNFKTKLINIGNGLSISKKKN